MQKSSRTRRRIVRDRATTTRFTASLRRGRSVATHLIAAGVTETDVIDGVRSGLQSAAKRLGIEPVKVVRAHRTVEGKGGRTRRTYHFTAAQVARMARSYRPRKAEYRAALTLFIASYGTPVTVRQTVRPVKVRELVGA